MNSWHHTPEQVKKAFSYAPILLHKLTDAGVQFPSLTLYEDASGTLNLGENITMKQYDLAMSLVKSRRQSLLAEGIGIDFCCGLVIEAEQED